jgi:hypothetical protein
LHPSGQAKAILGPSTRDPRLEAKIAKNLDFVSGKSR